MIPAGVRIFAATAPTDMRRGFVGLAEAARERLGHDPSSGALFVFWNKRRDRLKLLCDMNAQAGVFCTKVWSAVFPHSRDRSVGAGSDARQPGTGGNPRRRTAAGTEGRDQRNCTPGARIGLASWINQ